MREILIQIGIFELHSYVVCMALGLLVGVLLALRENDRLPKPYPVTGRVGIWGLVGGLIGAKTYFVIQYEEPSQWYNALFFWTGGYVFFGGLIGGIIGVWLYLRRHGVPFLPAGDIGVPFLCLGHAIGRFGCFLNGCCYGGLCGMPWGVIYPKESSVFGNQVYHRIINYNMDYPLPIHPTPIYEIIGLIMIYFLLRMIYVNKRYNGQVILWYVCLYGAWRFFDENFRGDSSHAIYGMTASQLIALCVCLLTVLLIFTLYVIGYRTKTPFDESLKEEEIKGSQNLQTVVNENG